MLINALIHEQNVIHKKEFFNQPIEPESSTYKINDYVALIKLKNTYILRIAEEPGRAVTNHLEILLEDDKGIREELLEALRQTIVGLEKVHYLMSKERI